MPKALPTLEGDKDLKKRAEKRREIEAEVEARRERIDLARRELAVLEQQKVEAVANGGKPPDTQSVREQLRADEEELRLYEAALRQMDENLDALRVQRAKDLGDELLAMDVQAHRALREAVEAAQAAYDRLIEIRQHAARELHGVQHPMAGMLERFELAQVFGSSGAVRQWLEWLEQQDSGPDHDGRMREVARRVWRDHGGLGKVNEIHRGRDEKVLGGRLLRRGGPSVEAVADELAEKIIEGLGARTYDGARKDAKALMVEWLEEQLAALQPA